MLWFNTLLKKEYHDNDDDISEIIMIFTDFVANNDELNQPHSISKSLSSKDGVLDFLKDMKNKNPNPNDQGLVDIQLEIESRSESFDESSMHKSSKQILSILRDRNHQMLGIISSQC